MARLWTCGFELQSATGGVEFSEASASAPTISTSIKRAGTASMRFNPSATVQYVSHQYGSEASRHVFYRMYLYVATMPNVDTIIMASCDSLGAAAGRSPRLFLKTNGQLQTATGSGSSHTYVGDSSATLSTGQWYRVELDYDSVNDVQHAYLDGTDFSGAVEGVGFTDFESAAIRVGAFTDTPAGSTTCDLYIDDIAVNDSTGSTQNGLPGPGSVVHLHPNAAGDSNGFATVVGGTAGAANNYTRVSETTPNDATSYNATTATGTATTDDFNLESSASAGIGSSDTITLVQVGARVGSSATTTASLVYRLKSQASGTAVEGSSAPVNLNGWCTHTNNAIRPYQLTSYTDPQAGGAWTPALLDTAQIGYRSNVSQSSTRRVSTLWALVEFVPVTEQNVTLGTARETSAARPITRYVPNLSTIVDNFNDGTINTALWTDSYNTGRISETGGRARVTCGTDYNAFAVGPAYTLTGSTFHVQVFPTEAGGGTTEAWSQVLVTSATPGTDLVMEVDAIAGELNMALRVDYFDENAVRITYDPEAHAWFRIREDAGTLYWETAPDGETWTQRRTATTPAWAADANVALQLISHRDTGADTVTEFDNVNTLPTGVEAFLGPATEAGAARGLAVGKVAPLGPASGADGGRPLSAAKDTTLGVGQAADEARPLTVSRAAVLGTAQETAAAQPLTPTLVVPLGPAQETTAAGPLAVTRTAALGAAVEEAAGRPLTASKSTTVGAGREASAAGAVGHARTAQVGRAADTATALPLTASRTVAAGAADAVDSARPVTAAKTMQLGTARSTEQAIAVMTAGETGITPAHDHDTGRALAVGKATALTAAAEQDTAEPLAGAKTGQLQAAATVDSARALAGGKARTVAGAREQARAGALTGAKQIILGPAREASAAQPLGALLSGGLGAAHARDTARPVIAAKELQLGAARAAEVAQPVTAGHRIPVARARAGERARDLAVGKTVRLGPARCTEQATVLTISGHTTLGAAREVAAARQVRQPFQIRRLRTARTVDLATAWDAQKQRPADELTPSVSGPQLVPSTSGPVLTATVTGPSLHATSTQGG